MAREDKFLQERSRRKRNRLLLAVGAIVAVAAVASAQMIVASPPGKTPQKVCPVDPDNRCVVIHVAAGDIVLEVFEKEVPGTAAHFLALMQTGYYNGLPWHRVEDWVIQTGQGDTVPSIKNEHGANLHNDRTFVGVARTSDPDSGNSQFYILRSDARHLDYQSPSNPGYCVFAKVVFGMELVDQVRLNDRIVQLTVVGEYIG